MLGPWKNPGTGVYELAELLRSRSRPKEPRSPGLQERFDEMVQIYRAERHEESIRAQQQRLRPRAASISPARARRKQAARQDGYQSALRNEERLTRLRIELRARRDFPGC